jgi:hypothetical protein
MPLWIILDIAVLKVLPDLIDSYFSGIWMISGTLLWITPHSIMTVNVQTKYKFCQLPVPAA